MGLGKTFTALAVIKYYEARNKDVLVLCSKKLSDNWMTYRNNQANSTAFQRSAGERYDAASEVTTKTGLCDDTEK